jgi:hypothetical protein
MRAGAGRRLTNRTPNEKAASEAAFFVAAAR